jgi:hypothetical protein
VSPSLPVRRPPFLDVSGRSRDGCGTSSLHAQNAELEPDSIFGRAGRHRVSGLVGKLVRMTAVSDEWATEARDRLPPMVRRFVERNLPEGALPNVTRVRSAAACGGHPVPSRWCPSAISPSHRRARRMRSSPGPGRQTSTQRNLAPHPGPPGLPRLAHSCVDAIACGRRSGRTDGRPSAIACTRRGQL